MTSPFLTVVTRCYKRPMMLARNQLSLQRQSLPDYHQVFIEDDVGRGMLWANTQLALTTDEIQGEYVLILDDDDRLEHIHAISNLKAIIHSTVSGDPPEVVVFKVNHGDRLGILPSDAVWEKTPIKGHIGSCSFIMEAGLWCDNIHHFAIEEGGDYAFLEAVWGLSPDVYWFPQVLARVQRVSRGKPE